MFCPEISHALSMKKARNKPKVKLKKDDSIAVKTCLISKTNNNPNVCFPFGGIDDSEFLYSGRNVKPKIYFKSF